MFFPYLQYVNEDGDSYCFTWFDNALSDVHTQAATDGTEVRMHRFVVPILPYR